MEFDGLFNILPDHTTGVEMELGAPSPTSMNGSGVFALLSDYTPLEEIQDDHTTDASSAVTCEGADPTSTSSNSDSNDDDGIEGLRMWKYRKTTIQGFSRKDEINLLRGELRGLQAELNRLQKKQHQGKFECGESENAGGDGVLFQSQGLWQRVALSQLELRRKSEIENETLREMVSIQVLEAKNLRRILKRRTKIETMKDMLGVKVAGSLQDNIFPGTTSAIRELMYGSKKQLLQVDSVFASKGMDHLAYNGHTRHADITTQSGIYFEFMQKRQIPFDVVRTEEATWKALRSFGTYGFRTSENANAHVNIYPRHTKEENDTLQMSFFAAISGSGKLVGVDVQKVARRHKGKDRFVFVLSLYLESRLEKAETGVRDSATMQIVLERSQVVEENDSDMTEMKLCFTAERDTPLRKDASGSLVIATWDDLVPQLVVDVETVLLDCFARAM